MFCLNTTQLECFAAVANFLNFSRAAEALRITQPAVSHQINTLEDELEVKLFYRTSKSVRLTRAGYLFLQYADDMLKLAGASKARLRECRDTQPTRVGVGCRNFIELRLLAPALAQLGREEPQLLPVLRMSPFDSLENLLEEGDVQLLLAYQEISPKRAVYRELCQRPVVCVCAESHPLAGQEKLTAAALREAGPMTLCRPPILPPSLMAAQSQVAANRGPEELLFCDSLEIAYTMAEAGLAFSLMADAPRAHLPGLRYIPVPEFPALSFGAAYLPKRLHQAHRRFLALLGESLGRQEETAQAGRA